MNRLMAQKIRRRKSADYAGEVKFIKSFLFF